jgi:hypothetical protein
MSTTATVTPRATKSRKMSTVTGAPRATKSCEVTT